MLQYMVHMVTIRVLRLKMALQNFLQTKQTNSYVNPFGSCGTETCTWPQSMQEHIRAQALQCLKMCSSIAIRTLTYQINAHIQLNIYIYIIYQRAGIVQSVYVVWQKSNETYFLLTMNFILFTNQGYPHQNSSLGQLHSDGGVVSIVCSSAGRLLLVYLSARRLRSSVYYPNYQNGALSSGF